MAAEGTPMTRFDRIRSGLQRRHDALRDALDLLLLAVQGGADPRLLARRQRRVDEEAERLAEHLARLADEPYYDGCFDRWARRARAARILRPRRGLRAAA